MLNTPNVIIHVSSQERYPTLVKTHRFKEAMRSVFVKLKPALHLVIAPTLVSKDRSVPRERRLVPTTPEKLTMGLAVNPRLVLIPA